MCFFISDTSHFELPQTRVSISQGLINSILESYSDEGKNPNPVIKGMSWIKTNVTLAINGSDSRVAELIMDGCNMGVKSLSRYLNQYKAADEQSKDIAKRLIELEDRLSTDMRGYL